GRLLVRMDRGGAGGSAHAAGRAHRLRGGEPVARRRPAATDRRRLRGRGRRQCRPVRPGGRLDRRGHAVTEPSFIAGVTSTREVWTGIALADSAQGLVDAIRSESWVDGLLAGAAFGVEVAASV